MKVSDCIELALVSGNYCIGKDRSVGSQYMCIVMDSYLAQKEITISEYTETINFIEELVNSFSNENSALVAALATAGYLEEARINKKIMEYTTQLYIWAVFDLKRKGL